MTQGNNNLDVINTAESLVKDMRDLLEFGPFQRFQNDLKKTCDMLANEILHDEMTPEQRENTRQFRLGVLSALKRPAEDMEAQCQVLANYGITASDVLHDGGGKSLYQSS